MIVLMLKSKIEKYQFYSELFRKSTNYLCILRCSIFWQLWILFEFKVQREAMLFK